MTQSYRLSRKAVQDLSNIWDYTAGEWGIAQAERYVRAIGQACESLARGQAQGQSAEYIRPGYRKHIIGRHLLFYRRLGDSQIEIVRILHQRMDVTRHL